MKLIVQKDILLSALKTADQFTDATASLSILHCVKIEARDGAIRIVGSDITSGVRVAIGGEILEPGAICIEAGPIAKALKTAPAGIVRLETEGYNLHIRFLRADIGLEGLGENEYVAFHEISDSNFAFCLRAASVAEALRATLLAATEFSRPALQCVRLSVEGTIATFVATDGRRLHRVETEVLRAITSDKPEPAPAVSIRIPFARTLAKLLAKPCGDTISFCIDTFGVCASIGPIDLYCKAHADTAAYPDYKGILPDAEQMAAPPLVLRTQETLDALDRFQALKLDPVSIRWGSAGLELRASREDKKSARTIKLAQTIDVARAANGPDLDETVWTTSLLADAIRSASTPDVFVRRAGSMLAVTGALSRDRSLAILMPQRV